MPHDPKVMSSTPAKPGLLYINNVIKQSNAFSSFLLPMIYHCNTYFTITTERTKAQKEDRNGPMQFKKIYLKSAYGRGLHSTEVSHSFHTQLSRVQLSAQELLFFMLPS